MIDLIKKVPTDADTSFPGEYELIFLDSSPEDGLDVDYEEGLLDVENPSK